MVEMELNSCKIPRNVFERLQEIWAVEGFGEEIQRPVPRALQADSRQGPQQKRPPGYSQYTSLNFLTI